MARIGLLGGSFNPAHRAHRRISLEAMRALALDEVWWLVSPGNPLKEGAKDMAPFDARFASASRTARGDARFASATSSAGRARAITVDTVRLLKRRHPEHRFIWLLGSDTLPNFHKWRDWRGLAREVPIAVIRRPGYDSAAHAARAMGWLQRVRPSFEPGEKWTEWSAPAILFLRLPPDPTSATAIRAQDPHGIADRKRAPRPLHSACHCSPGDHLTEHPVEDRRGGRQAPVDVEDLHKLVLQSLDDDQAQEVVSIPLTGKSNIADHMVIASGRSTRQVASMAVKLADKIKQQFGRIVRIEGLPAADWVLIDADDVIVHIFRPEVRNFYNLERMWAFGDNSGVSAAARG